MHLFYFQIRELNEKILNLQMTDLEIKKKEEKEIKERKLLKLKEEEAKIKEIVEIKVREVKEKAKKFIDPTKLDYEIEKMLNERIDYNFCINSKGVKYKENTSDLLSSSVNELENKTKDTLPPIESTTTSSDENRL